MNHVDCRALLVITRVDSQYCPFEVTAFVQRGGYDGIEDDFSLLETASLPLPFRADKLSVGDTLRIDVRCTFYYDVDHLGEYYAELFYHKCRTLRLQRARGRRYFKREACKNV